MKKEDYSEYYIQGSDHILLPIEIFDKLFDEVEYWKNKVQNIEKELIKILEEEWQ